jgi:hypothetical protein
MRTILVKSSATKSNYTRKMKALDLVVSFLQRIFPLNPFTNYHSFNQNHPFL